MPPGSAPAMAARNAEMQKTSTRVTRTLVPLVVSPSGESAIARDRRPRRLRDQHDHCGDHERDNEKHT